MNLSNINESLEDGDSCLHRFARHQSSPVQHTLDQAGEGYTTDPATLVHQTTEKWAKQWQHNDSAKVHKALEAIEPFRALLITGPANWQRYHMGLIKIDGKQFRQSLMHLRWEWHLEASAKAPPLVQTIGFPASWHFFLIKL